MQASWKALPLRHSLVINRQIGPWAFLAAWFAIGVAVPIVPAQAQAPAAQPTATAPAPVEKEQPQPASPGRPHESVKVHGHWVIEVRNPDGSLAQHHEFENSLVNTGQSSLEGLLLGTFVSAGWGVVLHAEGAGPDSPCVGGSCLLVQQQVASLRPCSKGACSTNLTATLANGSQAGINLSGWIQATQAGNIGEVLTVLYVCEGQGGFSGILGKITPAQCAAGPATNFNPSAPEFTLATLPASSTMAHPCGGSGENSCEITGIKANQMINVSVTITFQ